MSEPRDPDSVTDEENEVRASADHDREINAFGAALRALIARYWFIGRVELVGAIEVEKGRLIARALDLSARDGDDDDGEGWKQGATRV